jgi:hypothetical protein
VGPKPIQCADGAMDEGLRSPQALPGSQTKKDASPEEMRPFGKETAISAI